MAETELPCISVLVVAYNSREFIDDCLTAIADAASPSVAEVLLIDNGADGTAAHVASRHPQVRLVEGQGNIGFARGIMLLAAEAKGQRLLLVNPDVALCEDAIRALEADAREHPAAAAWGGVTLDASGASDTGNLIRAPDLPTLARAVFGGQPPEELAAGRVAMLSGGFVLLNRAAWDAAGGFDESYFLYCEEVDLFHRLRAKGWSLRRVPDARAHHAIAHGNSLSPRRLLFMAAGKAHFLHRHRALPVRLTGIGLIWLAAMVRVLAGATLGWRNARWRELGLGYREVAFSPFLWMHGYDPERGLTARLGPGGAKGR